MSFEIPETMIGMKLPGGAKVERVEQTVPKPGPGQVLLKMKAASLCGSDLKYIYYEHTDKTGGARYDNVIAGHEPSGQVVQVGEGVLDFKEGDRVLVMGFGPVGQAAIILAKAMGAHTIGIDISEERLQMAKKIGADQVFMGDDDVVENVLKYTGGTGVEVAIDCSGSSIGRHRCLEVARMWGQVVYLGEQGTVTFEPSPLLLHKNLTLHGSWVTSVANMERLVELLDWKKIHPSQIITHRYPLEETEEAL